MKKSIIIFLLLSSFVSNSSALTYDFESPTADVLDGLTVGTFSVNAIPLEVQAGTLDAEGNFTLGGADATLSVVSPGSISSFPLAGGLGVNSTLNSGTDLSQALEGINQEGLLFNFDPLFNPEILRFRVFGDVTGFHVFSNLGNPVIASVGGGPSGSDGYFILKPGVTTLSLNIATGTDPAVFITAIEGQTPTPISLVVDLQKGTVGVNDPCPVPRTRSFYLELNAALQCAESGDTIRLRPGYYREDEVSIHQDNIRIVGSGPNQTIFYYGSGGFTVHGGLVPNIPKVEIKNLTLSNEAVSNSAGFENYGDLVIRNCVFAGNYAETGGALLNYWKMRVYDSVFINNKAKFGAAIANFVSLNVIRTTILQNSAESGGGIFNAGDASLTVVESLISENEGAGIYNESRRAMKLRRTVIEGNSPVDCVGCP